MTTLEKPQRRGRAPRTYLPEPSSRNEISDFADFLRVLGLENPQQDRRSAALVSPGGEPRPIPEDIFRILEQVTDSLAKGDGITVIPSGALLTTQQAADFLGISRPTLVKLLEAGKIEFERPGRHRRVALRNLINYQESSGSARQDALAELAKANVGEATRVVDPTTATRRPPML